jgi:hypothetical protein
MKNNFLQYTKKRKMRNQTHKKTKKKGKTYKTYKTYKTQQALKGVFGGFSQKARNYTNKHRKLPKQVACSPFQELSYTCYSKERLQKMLKLWNARHPDNPFVSNDPQQIYQHLIAYFKDCKTESCWLKKFHVKRTEVQDLFAPLAPASWDKKPNEWLSDYDIAQVMKQYEKKYTCFTFMGPSPIDFDKPDHQTNTCVWPELCTLQLKTLLQQKKTKLGIIFNTDTHDKSGQHWISMFVNLKKHQIFYFDSVGEPMPPEIKALIERICQQGLQLQPPIHFDIDSNEGIQHQYGNTECGIYSLFFIVHMLEDKITKNYVKTHILKDKYMQQFRQKYFNSPSNFV